MGLPKKAKGGSKSKSRGGKDRDGKQKEPKKPQIMVRDVNREMSGHLLLALSSWLQQGFCTEEHPRKYRSWDTFLVWVGPWALPQTIMSTKQLLLSSRTVHSWWTAGQHSLAAALCCTAAAGCATHQSSQLLVWLLQ